MAAEKKCPECGYKNELRATFCGNCGNPLHASGSAAPPPPSTLPEEVPAASRTRSAPPSRPEAVEPVVSSAEECPKCRYPARSEDVFCRQCGATLIQRPLYCPRCGDPIDPDETFCNRCGLALR